MSMRQSIINLEKEANGLKFGHEPPRWILKRDGLDTSGGRLYSKNGRTKIVAFLVSFSFP